MRQSTDPAIAAAMSAPPTTSRFFMKPTVQPSPSLRTKSNRKQEDFELWSDDSVAEAVAAASATPDLSQDMKTLSSRKRKKISVLVDPEALLIDESVCDVSQDSILTIGTPQSQASVNCGTPDTSFDSSASPLPEDKQPRILSKGVLADLSMFRFGGPTSQQKMSTPRTKSEMLSKVPLRSDEPNLQRSPPVAAKDFVPDSSPPAVAETVFRSDVAVSDDDAVKDDEWHAIEKLSTRRIAIPKGSEDMIVPNSPEGDEDRPTLELSKYLFNG